LASNGQELPPLQGHTGPVTAVAFSPDSQTLGSASTDGTVRLWEHLGRFGDPAFPQNCAVLRAHPIGIDQIAGVAFSPDGSIVAGATHAAVRPLKLWDAATGQERASLDFPDLVHCVAFSPDGRTLAAGGRGPIVKLWDPATGIEQRTLATGAGHVSSLAFTPDGTVLATASGAGGVEGVKLWDVPSGRELAFQPDLTGGTFCVAFAANGRVLASGHRNGVVRLRHASSGQEFASLTGHRAEISGLAYSPSGKTLVTASRDGTVKVWYAPTD
jgi:WD40 repeat protein